LQGSRKIVYQNVVEKCIADGMFETQPERAYAVIKARLLEFSETPMERQIRVRADWRNLGKQNLTAKQFEAEFVKAVNEMEKVGMALTRLDKFLGYIEKVGPKMSEVIRLDRRPRSDGTIRLVETWEEAHEVLVEHEGVKNAGRVICEHSGGRSLIEKSPSKESGAARSGKGKGKGACHQMRDHGTCQFGENCRFSHDPETIAEAKRAVEEDDGEETQPEDEAPEADTKPQRRDRRKSILCKHLKDPDTHGECPLGLGACPYSHNVKKWQRQKGKGKGKGKGAAVKDEDEDEENDWGIPGGLGSYGIRLVASDATGKDIVQNYRGGTSLSRGAQPETTEIEKQPEIEKLQAIVGAQQTQVVNLEAIVKGLVAEITALKCSQTSGARSVQLPLAVAAGSSGERTVGAQNILGENLQATTEGLATETAAVKCTQTSGARSVQLPPAVAAGKGTSAWRRGEIDAAETGEVPPTIPTIQRGREEIRDRGTEPATTSQPVADKNRFVEPASVRQPTGKTKKGVTFDPSLLNFDIPYFQSEGRLKGKRRHLRWNGGVDNGLV